ncbi:5-(carboxyamino)imidazole ribonucleotide mutase [Candidatus Bathyarchaeota archaeon]|nr:MAG: 5-(carboxyamino)imidazole ribonucleotide mutase [Candidatus Hecatellales archaeon]RLI35020.1 MAG: 5-(carboxyamino)imidazole ribonucleotide mutase [Candidatus Bathyarchaeota archaeon]
MAELKPPKVAIIIGSSSDTEVANRASKVLNELGIPHETKVLSAHRQPKELEAYVEESPAEVFIAIAGLAAALPGFIASRTIKPVIGVPRDVRLGGLDALLSIAQMPKGVPVACMGIEAGENAALMAARILALKDPEIAERLKKYPKR